MALLGVGLDDRALLGRERTGLEQDRVGDRDLADVVQGRSVLEALAELGVHADVLGQQHREATDALDVRAGVLVAELDRHRQALDGLGLGDLELGECSFEVGGAAVDLILERAAAVLADTPAERHSGAAEHEQADCNRRGDPRDQRGGDRGQTEQRPSRQA